MANFETVKAQVKIGGSAHERVMPYGGRPKVTAPEFAVLQLIHGEANVTILDAAVDLTEREKSDELDRLKKLYDVRSNAEKHTGRLPTERLFPTTSSLPTTFADLEIKHPALDQAAKDRKAKVRTAKADAPADSPADGLV